MCSTFGNSLTLAAILNTPSLWTKTNKLLANFAAAELVVAASAILIFAYNLVTAANNLSACKFLVIDTLLKTFRNLPPRVSINFLLLIGIDRYVAIIHPYAYEMKLTDRTLNWLIVGAWATGLLFFISDSLWIISANQVSCEGVPNVIPNLYSFVTIAGEYFAVSIFLIVVYSKILRVTWKQSVAIGCEAVPGSVASKSDNSCSTPAAAEDIRIDQHQHQHQQLMTKMRQRQLKAVVLTAVIVGVFIFLWFPFALYFFMAVVCSPSDILGKFQDISTSIALSTFSFNWIIYAAISKSYQRAYKALLCGCNK